MKTQLIATKAFSYGGRSLKPGGAFEATGQHARLLVGIGKATYQTRVMVAEPPAPPVSKSPAPAPKAPAEKPPVARKTPARKTTTGKSDE